MEEKPEHPPIKDGGAGMSSEAPLQKEVCSDEGKMLRLISCTWRGKLDGSIRGEGRRGGKNVGTNSCTFPNLQPIDWALAGFTRPLYLHF